MKNINVLLIVITVCGLMNVSKSQNGDRNECRNNYKYN